MAAAPLAETVPFPRESRMRWRRIDVPGTEEARVVCVLDGWQLEGELDLQESGTSARLRYTITCDAAWRTRSAVVEGALDGRPVRFALQTDTRGAWTCGGAAIAELAGAADIDLAFTPATNTLPIRRLSLAVGETRPVRSAWLRFPELRIEALDQTYTRAAACVYRYHAQIDGEPFVARLDTDVFGRVLQYEGLWTAEYAWPAGASREVQTAAPEQPGCRSPRS
jgi:hypothetical protein